MARRYTQAWTNSDRKERLPRDWQQRRKKIIARASRDQSFARCEAIDDDGERCAHSGRDVDHIRAGDDHALANLRLLCVQCHRAKTTQEGTQARAAHLARRYRPPEAHPGARTQ